MDSKVLEIVKDDIWNSFHINSIEHFENLISEISFQKNVSDDVVKRFEVVKKLILYSYYEYDFLDVAFERSLSNFELALRKRYFEIEQCDAGKKDLQELINWANSKGLFEDSKDRIDSIRKLRNNIVGHPKVYRLFGTISLNMIFPIVDIINGLYEDVGLRFQRKQESRNIKKQLEIILKNGAIFQQNDKKLIIFYGQLLHFNNIKKPYKYHFLFYPIFDPRERDNRIDIPKPIIIEAKSYSFQNESFIIDCFDNEKIIIDRIQKSENLYRFCKWKEELNASSFPFVTAINIEVSKYEYFARKSNL